MIVISRQQHSETKHLRKSDRQHAERATNDEVKGVRQRFEMRRSPSVAQLKYTTCKLTDIGTDVQGCSQDSSC